jgi:Pectate lyase superfamily protein
MSSDVTKRALSAGLGVGALALLAPRASADTPFSSFAFRATGAPTARTLPDRLGELKNVKDFGAVGNGSTDDTAAVQAAVNQGGQIFFPPGQYLITQSINITQDPVGISFLGTPQTLVAGSFNGYLFDRQTSGDDTHHIIFEKLAMINDSHGASAGCISIAHGACHTIRDCFFRAYRPVTLLSVLDAQVNNCLFRSSDLAYEGVRDQLSIGCLMDTNNAVIQNCDFNGFWQGIRIGQNACAVRDSRIENCYYGIVGGVDRNGNDYPSGVTIDSIEMEACSIFIWLKNVGGGYVRGVGMLGDGGFSVPNDGGPNDKPSLIGIEVDNVTGLVVESCTVGGVFQDAGVKFAPTGAPPPVRSSWISVISQVDQRDPVTGITYPTALSWKGMELLNRNTITFIQCNNP